MMYEEKNMASYPSKTVTNVNYYHQLYSDDCAATCLCMCMKVPPATANNAYPNYYDDGVSGVQWANLANQYGYQWSGLKTSSILTSIYNKISNNIPVIVKVNNTQNNPHWVVIIASIATNTLTNSSFMCFDPSKTSSPVRVIDSTRYEGIYKYGYVT